MSAAKIQLHLAEVVILVTFSAAGFEVAAALYSWREGAFVSRYLFLALILLAAGLGVNEVYRRIKVGSLRVVGAAESDRRQ